MLKLNPKEVIPVINEHMLVDGHSDIVLDLQKSRGSYIYDSLNERKYLDMFGFFATSPIGHNHPALKSPEFQEKILSVAVMKPSNSDFYSAEMAEFVKTFSEHAIPETLPYLFLISGGALAVENALKAAFDWKVRRNFQKGYKKERGYKVIHFKEAFHGRSGYTLSLTNTADPRKTKHFPKFDWPRITNPKITFPFDETSLERAILLERQAILEIKDAIQKERDDLATIIIEPIQGEGGDNHFRKEFFQELRHLADENDIMLIFDEVQTGVGLTGKMWCYQYFGVEPDMICFGKKTQVCGFLCGKRIEQVENHVFEESSRINSTWGGNLVDMVRFRKYLEVIVTENLVENAATVGRYFTDKLLVLRGEFAGKITNVRGRGLMIAFDLPDLESRDAFLQTAYKNGMIALGCGQRSVRFRPTLDVTTEVIDEAMILIEKSLKQVISYENNQVASVTNEATVAL